MTNKEALIAALQDVSVPDLTIEKVLLDNEIDGAAAYTSAGQKPIDLCTITILYGLYTSPDVSEGGYSVSHPDFLRKIEARLLYLAKKHNVTEILNQFQPTISNGTNRW